ncbi:Ig-like domain-containing protein [Pseudomonas sp. A-RE-19]|uniref:Ig-like domain-containing protein n=1 Tax=Pseudomonas sp. A-RE-19 TaxID=2832401 RepID=UPI001CBC8259|nr:Ig-like domain-containing protein [Pseudomonas sp. A-RE-19]
MDINDSVEKNANDVDLADVSDDVKKDAGIERTQEQESALRNLFRGTGNIRVTYDNLWADLEYYYEWHPEGTSITVGAIRYRAFDNDRKYGDIDLGYFTPVDWWEARLTEDAIQDGNWHNISGGDVPKRATLGEPVEVKFAYTWDMPAWDPKSASSDYISYSVPAPIISGPSGEIAEREFTVRGTNGAYGYGVIHVFNSSSNDFLSEAHLDINGGWTASVTLPSGTDELTFYARQIIGTRLSNYSNHNRVFLKQVVVPVPRIDSPANGTVPNKQFVVRGSNGNASEGSISLYNNANGTVLAVATIGAGGSWTANVTLPSETQPLTFYAKQKFGDKESGNSNSVTVQLAQPDNPDITAPVSGSVQPTTFTLSGNKGTVGARIRVFKDLTNDKVGESAALTSANWTCSVTVAPGPISLVAQAFKDGWESVRSEAVAYKITPPAITAVVATHTETTVTFSGSGHTGATVEITKVSGPEATMPSPATVTGGKWEATATNWPFGTYSLTAIQKVSDNAGGWIESQPYTFTVDRVVPQPGNVTYTTDYRPTFSGTGYNGATVKLFAANNVTPVAPDARVSDRRWSSQASEVWGPTFEREVHLKQYLGGQESPTWLVVKVTIAPLAPGMNEPVEDGLSPQLSGTCWPGAVLQLTYSDSPSISHPVTNNNGTWSFRRDTPFAEDVIHTVSITQTAAGQTSVPGSKTFEVFLPVLKPTITQPDPSSEVGRDVTIEGGNGMVGATMQLRDAQFGRNLGDPKVLTQNGHWSIDLVGLEFRPYTIDAKQTRKGRENQSDPHVFDVVVLPPEFTAPVENGSLPRTAMIEGTALPFGKVSVWLQGVDEPLLKDIEVDRDGHWKAEVTLPVGRKTIWAVQTFEGLTSKNSQQLNYNVVPASPVIETPTSNEPIGARTVVSGFGVPGDTITVRLNDGAQTVLGSSPVLEDRTWSLTVTIERLGGPCDLIAVASLDGFDSASSARSVVLGTYLPSIDVPTPGSWVSGPVRFEGRGRPGVGQVVSWFNPDLKWSADVPVSPGNWQGEAGQSMSAGGHWCRFTQTLTDGADGATISDWVESQRFEILPPSTQP